MITDQVSQTNEHILWTKSWLKTLITFHSQRKHTEVVHILDQQMKWWENESLVVGLQQSRLFQQTNLHLQVGLQVLIQNVILNSGKCTVASVMVVRQQLLCVFDPDAVMTAAHTAVGGSRRRTLIRRPDRGTGVRIRFRAVCQWGCSRRVWSIREVAGGTFPPRPQGAMTEPRTHRNQLEIIQYVLITIKQSANYLLSQ